MSNVDVQFGIVPLWLIEKPISDGAVRLYAYLAAKYVDGNMECWPGVERLADELGKSTATISARLKELADVGAIHRRRRIGTSSLTILGRLENWTFESQADCMETIPSENHTQSTYPNPEKSTLIDKDFEQFYKAFPVRKARAEARRKYRAARKDVSHEEIMVGLAAYVKDVEKRRASDFPELKWQAPAAWLNQGRWADEYDTPAADPRRADIEKARRVLSLDQREEAKSCAAYPYDNESARIMGER